MTRLVLAVALVLGLPTIITQTRAAEFDTPAVPTASPQERTSATAREREPVRYQLRIPAPRTHYIEIEATYPTERRPTIELMMAVWTPGSYLVREFSRHVESVRARDLTGRPLVIEKSRKNRWHAQTGGASRIVVTYRVYAYEQQARTNWVEDSFALINGAPTFITLAEQRPRPHEVALELPPDWSLSFTSLAPSPDGRPHRYRAPDYDALVDSPIVAGNPTVYEFIVDGVKHFLGNVGDSGEWDGARSVRDIEQIVRAAREIWGSLPYERYFFFNFLSEGEPALYDDLDGIEHRMSTVLRASRRATSTDGAYREWLGLVAHEFFHAWNVKRLRPVELGPFDYENEVYTKSLWVAEGLSDYYAWLLVCRAGLMTQEQTLANYSRWIRSLQTTPGRLVQSLEQSSYDAWIKQYRPDENSVNVSVSYYTKGSIVGLLLDARIRRATDGRRSLDDVMRLAYRRFSGERGFTPSDFRAVVSEVAGTDFDDFFDRALETTAELDYAELLDWYGLRFASPSPDVPKKAVLGATTRVDNGHLLVASILRDTPAYASGLAPGDELLAIDNLKLDADGLEARLEQYRPGDTVTVLALRRHEERPITVTLGAMSADVWALEIRSDASEQQKRRLDAWLKGQ